MAGRQNGIFRSGLYGEVCLDSNRTVFIILTTKKYLSCRKEAQNTQKTYLFLRFLCLFAAIYLWYLRTTEITLSRSLLLMAAPDGKQSASA